MADKSLREGFCAAVNRGEPAPGHISTNKLLNTIIPIMTVRRRSPAQHTLLISVIEIVAQETLLYCTRRAGYRGYHSGCLVRTVAVDPSGDAPRWGDLSHPIRTSGRERFCKNPQLPAGKFHLSDGRPRSFLTPLSGPIVAHARQPPPSRRFHGFP